MLPAENGGVGGLVLRRSPVPGQDRITSACPSSPPRFLLFLLSALTVFWALRRSRPAQKLLLIAASVWFYGSYGWEFVALLGLSVAGNHLAAGLVAASAGAGARALARSRG